MNIQSTYRANDGSDIPALGLGTWDMYHHDLKQAVSWAIETGYRHFDTATYYKNEKELGEALRASEVSRDDLFVTTKLRPSDFSRAKQAFESSYNALDLEYIDLYLIHWPSGKKETNEAWKILLELEKDDRLRSIGVSNYSIKQLEELKSLGDTIPVTNQVEFHPWIFDAELLDYCKSENILLTAYSPLTEAKRLRDKRLSELAAAYRKSPAQILLRWALQHGTIIIPKSSNENRIKENASIFDFTLTGSDMELLNQF
ncbi:MAG: aldo/keto reductase [Candidatus Heimdallarchaeota archaeon]|nr:aldo/keto reductase [Candidatus Heimdallarchaeota archaeon]